MAVSLREVRLGFHGSRGFRSGLVPPSDLAGSIPWNRIRTSHEYAKTWEAAGTAHSHSIVPGGLLVRSSTTRLTPRTSFVIRVLIFSSSS